MVILSDDEDEKEDEDAVEVVDVIKKEVIEKSTENANEESAIRRSPDMIDLTDEVFEDAEVPRHYISWLTDLIQRAKLKPIILNPRIDTAESLGEVIVIEDPDDNRDADQPLVSKVRFFLIFFFSLEKIWFQVCSVAINEIFRFCILYPDRSR